MVIDNAVHSVPVSMNDENRRNGRGWREGGSIILLFNPLKVEAHPSETTCSNHSCSAFIKV